MMNMVLSAAIEAQAGDTFEISSRAMQAMVRLALGPPELHQPHLAEQLDQFEREAVGFVYLGCDRRDMPCDHSADGVAERDLLLGEAHGVPGSSFCGKSKKGLPLNG